MTVPFVIERFVDEVYIHCSTSDHAKHDNVETINKWHLDRGWDGIGYHFVITKNGMIHTGRDIEKTPAAQKGHNEDTIAICLTGDKVFSWQQLTSLRQLCITIHRMLPDCTFHGHTEVSTKTCPNIDYKMVLGLVSGGIMDQWL